MTPPATAFAVDARSLLEGMPARYRLHRLLGAGGFGAVYLATDDVLQREVAIKVLTRIDTGDRDALRREARALAAVSHANIVNVLDVLELPRADALVLEYVPGGTVGSVLETGRVPPRDHALRWISGVAAALAAVHNAGLLHCDLKPENVLVDATGTARLTDFGVARWTKDADATAAGSLGYAAPEVLLGDAPSAASDLYSLGVVAWEMLTGRRAFEAARTFEVLRQQTMSPLPPLANVASDLPAEIRDVLSRCLNADPADRPASAQEVRDVLARCAPRDFAARQLDGLGITVVAPMVVLAGLVGTALLAWVDIGDLAALADGSPLRLLTRRFRLLAEVALALIATAGLFVSAVVVAVRRLLQAGDSNEAATIGTVLRRVFAAPRWWPTWYPGQGEPADVRRLPTQIRQFRLLVWWGLPVVLTLVAFLLVLSLGRPPVVGLAVARVALGVGLASVCLALAVLMDIVVTYRESPIYDVFELAAIAVARPVMGDVARALPVAGSEQHVSDDAPRKRRWYTRLMQSDDWLHARVEQSPTAQRIRAWGPVAVGLAVVGWLGLVVVNNTGGSWGGLRKLFD